MTDTIFIGKWGGCNFYIQISINLICSQYLQKINFWKQCQLFFTSTYLHSLKSDMINVFFSIDCTPPFEVYVYADSASDGGFVITGTRGKCYVL